VNNLHRELAPISDEAWTDLEAEARRTFTRHLAGRRVVDLIGPGGTQLSAVGTGHVRELAAPADGVRALGREVLALVEFRVPFTVSRHAVDDVARGARDADWQPVKDAAKKMAFTEDGVVFDGFAAGGITGIGAASSCTPLPLPADAREYPTVVAQALTQLRLAGVAGPYTLVLSADAYTTVAETSEHGYPITQHLARLIGDGEIIWAPAISGGYLLSTRGGDFELHLGQDLSIGYTAHTAESVDLYFQESLTFVVQTPEAAVSLTA
jgi:uncharacterized linocin/CFP29 family protein